MIIVLLTTLLMLVRSEISEAKKYTEQSTHGKDEADEKSEEKQLQETIEGFGKAKRVEPINEKRLLPINERITPESDRKIQKLNDEL